MELTEGFADLGLSEPLLAAVAEAGYTAPTPIQLKGIPLVLRGVDLLGCAETGTGKTASYALPIIDISELRHRQAAYAALPSPGADAGARAADH